MSRMKDALVALACAAAVIAAVPGTARAWNGGTHVYVADHLRKGGEVPVDALRARLYGSLAVDTFNFARTPPFLAVADYFHEYTADDVAARLWAAALATHDPVLMEFAYGFNSHDNAIGADFTAHVDAQTGGYAQGYVIHKAEILAPSLALALGVPAEQLALPAHVLVEIAVDVLIREELDPAIGTKLLGALEADTAEQAELQLLVDTFREPLAPYFGGGDAGAPAAEAALRFWNGVYRHSIMLQYGSALAAGRGPVAQWTQGAAKQLFGIDVTYETAYALLSATMDLVRPDYEDELLATIGRTNANLSTRDVFP